jgi:hypothetical protein
VLRYGSQRCSIAVAATDGVVLRLAVLQARYWLYGLLSLLWAAASMLAVEGLCRRSNGVGHMPKPQKLAQHHGTFLHVPLSDDLSTL